MILVLLLMRKCWYCTQALDITFWEPFLAHGLLPCGYHRPNTSLLPGAPSRCLKAARSCA